MKCMDLLQINLLKVTNEETTLSLDLHDDFFQNLDQNEIKAGNINLSLKIRESAGETFIFKFKIHGTVIVECDRCLDDLALDVEAEETIKVKYEDESDSFADDIKFISKNTTTYDASWDVYEIVELAVPIQRTHNIEECNEDMLSHICYEDIEVDED
jgi:uncharacterized metal-binding protein YceD (DUF177 family)